MSRYVLWQTVALDSRRSAMRRWVATIAIVAVLLVLVMHTPLFDCCFSVFNSDGITIDFPLLPLMGLLIGLMLVVYARGTLRRLVMQSADPAPVRWDYASGHRRPVSEALYSHSAFNSIQLIPVLFPLVLLALLVIALPAPYSGAALFALCFHIGFALNDVLLWASLRGAPQDARFRFGARQIEVFIPKS